MTLIKKTATAWHGYKMEIDFSEDSMLFSGGK
jgi:hypothetical protein